MIITTAASCNALDIAKIKKALGKRALTVELVNENLSSPDKSIEDVQKRELVELAIHGAFNELSYLETFFKRSPDLLLRKKNITSFERDLVNHALGVFYLIETALEYADEGQKSKLTLSNDRISARKKLQKIADRFNKPATLLEQVFSYKTFIAGTLALAVFYGYSYWQQEKKTQPES